MGRNRAFYFWGSAGRMERKMDRSRKQQAILCGKEIFLERKIKSAYMAVCGLGTVSDTGESGAGGRRMSLRFLDGL